MPSDGVVGESKWAILSDMAAGSPDAVPPTVLLADNRVGAAKRFAKTHGFPIVLKPEMGERGREVAIIRSNEALRSYIAANPSATLAQKYVGGLEFGVFFVRLPDETRGRVISVAHKQPLVVVGDGGRTLERLILDDARAVLLAHKHLRRHREQLHRVPDDGERV
jgi:carbamoylphosphate synthase large subunit